jgi:site-specific DNA-methyltransferase (adenine-specific)
LIAHFYIGSWKDIHHQTPTTPDATKRTARRKGRPVHWNDMNGSKYQSQDGGPRLMRSVLFHRSCHGTATNPTQKPEGLIRPLIEYIAGHDTIVLDPFTGSGVVPRVASDMGLRSIAIDVRESECESAARRLSQEVLIHA